MGGYFHSVVIPSRFLTRRCRFAKACGRRDAHMPKSHLSVYSNEFTLIRQKYFNHIKIKIKMIFHNFLDVWQISQITSAEMECHPKYSSHRSMNILYKKVDFIFLNVVVPWSNNIRTNHWKRPYSIPDSTAQTEDDKENVYKVVY